MTTAEKLNQKYNAAKRLNNELAAQISGNVAVGKTATYFVNANKALIRIEKQVRNAYYNGDITTEEYKRIFNHNAVV